MIERIVLLGYMCSGKSSVGEALARRLEWRFLDFDVEIERREARPVGAIIDAEGEEYFRGAEAGLTREVGEDKADQVIAFTQVCRVVPLDTEIALAAAEACREHELATAEA